MEKSAIEPVELTKKLVGFDTRNPPGNEAAIIDYLGSLLDEAGFTLKTIEFEQGRPNLIASLGGNDSKPPLCFAGHVDTVGLGEVDWKVDPFNAVIEGNKIFGRGTSDMKGGIAAMVCAALKLAKLKQRNGGIEIILCASEETGSEGAKVIIDELGMNYKVGLIICPEPTSNYPLIGHKGVLWLTASAEGKAAHGSTPELGDNAIYKASDAIQRLRKVDFKLSDPVFGSPTFNVGTIKGGNIVNQVADSAEFKIDIRTIPGRANSEYLRILKGCLGPDIIIQEVNNLASISSDFNCPEIKMVNSTFTRLTGIPVEARCAKYFTDCSYLTPGFGDPPTVIFGPGELSKAHAVDEFCYVSNILSITEVFIEIGREWLSG